MGTWLAQNEKTMETLQRANSSGNVQMIQLTFVCESNRFAGSKKRSYPI